ncbi:ChaB family protein [Nonomuraea sp. NPDC050153]|uniref:ChaB family protein n=1 Tax=Nonomuraea sp. NPDC050153 TaxID=3364359 RepID=UPI00378BE5AC
MPAVEELPSTIKRSPKKAQNTWLRAHDNAVREYGEGRRAHMTAFAAMKRSFEKVGDHWEPKKGPTDKATMNRTAGRAGTTRTTKATTRTGGKAGVTTRTTKAATRTGGKAGVTTRTTKAVTRTAKAAMTRTAKTAEGVNLNATKEYLQKMAAKLDVRGRSKMTKQELVNAIRRANRRLTTKAR